MHRKIKFWNLIIFAVGLCLYFPFVALAEQTTTENADRNFEKQIQVLQTFSGKDQALLKKKILQLQTDLNLEAAKLEKDKSSKEINADEVEIRTWIEILKPVFNVAKKSSPQKCKDAKSKLTIDGNLGADENSIRPDYRQAFDILKIICSK